MVITKLRPNLEVEAKEGKNFSIAMNKMNKGTAVTRDKKKVGASELKDGQSVVVDATRDSEADLLALDVRIAPEITSSAGK